MSEATRIREEVAATIDAKEAEYTQEAVALGDIIDNTEVSGEHSRRSYLAINWTDCLHISALLAHLDKTNIYR